jgi:chorismate mutase/prephenate dehydratase
LPVSAPPPSTEESVRSGAFAFGAPALFAGPRDTADFAQSARDAKGAGAAVFYAAHLELDDRKDAEPMLDRLARAAGEAGIPLAVGIDHAADASTRALRADLLVVDTHHGTQRSLLEELGRIDCAVALTRASTATLEEWLEAADLIRRSGNARVLLLDAGVRVLGRRALDLASLPTICQRTKSPVLVDLSVGEEREAMMLARAALAAGARGLVCPWIDGEASAQSLGALVASSI